MAAVGLFLLVEKRQVLFVESFEPVVPFNMFEFVFSGASEKVNAEDAACSRIIGAADDSGFTAVLFCLLTDLVVFGCGLAFSCHWVLLDLSIHQDVLDATR